MPKLGMMEILLLLLIVVILFGSTRIPQLGKGLGEGIRNFRKGLRGEEPPTDPSSKGDKQ